MVKAYYYRCYLEEHEIKYLKEHYSIRKLAKKLKISPSFLYEILTHKRYIPQKRIKDFRRILGL